jgi:hypothetical protein
MVRRVVATGLRMNGEERLMQAALQAADFSERCATAVGR